MRVGRIEPARYLRPRILLSVRRCRLGIWLVVTAVLLHGPSLRAQEVPATEPATAKSDEPLQFAFDGAPWRDVIKWVATEAKLALHVSDVPTGSFTYSDSSSFTHDEAIARVNLFLLPQGFTLVRSGKLLSVINLGDSRSMQQMDAIARMVTVEQLDELNDHDVVKCIFPLGELDAEDAVEELSALNLMTTPAVFTKTNQLMITDTAGKLKNVKAIIDAFQPRMLDNGTVVKTFALKHVEAEDILAVARPHLGLAIGEMIGIDVSLSADLQGKNIFVTGIEDKVKLIEGLVTAIDIPSASLSLTNGESQLRSHLIAGGNVETVYNVLLTLLASKGESVRLSMDETAGAIVALATPEVQLEIEQTVLQLQAAEADFEVIPLKTVDPYLVITLLEQMLDLPDPMLDDPDDIDPDAPKIDADPGNMRLFVRAKKHQIEQIKKIVAGLDSGGIDRSNDKIRIFPLRGEQAKRLLKTAAKFWRAPNPIIYYPSTDNSELEETERVVAEQPKKSTLTDVSTAKAVPQTGQYLTDDVHSEAPPIRCHLTPRGLLLQSDDAEALDTFEDHLRTIAGPVDSTPSPPVVFYLKYAMPDDAIRMLAELLDGGEAAKEGEAGTLVNGYVSSGSAGSFLGSLVTSREGTTTMIAGSITVVADSRLNRLIAQGTANEIELIERYLKIVDKDTSITSIETYGTSHVIELSYTKASEVATAIREAYAGRVAGVSGAGAGVQPGVPQQGQREVATAKAPQAEGEEQEKGKKNPERKPASQPARNLEPTMTIAIHEPSNSLIVTAPEQLFNEVEQLAKLIDSRNEQSLQVITLPTAVGIESMLQQLLSGGASSGSSSRPSTPAPRPQVPSTSPAPSPNRFKSGR
ncbi:MAG: general secretion pathway protein [Planctomycetes bacterium]|nr:general secretion pathway protein [Planctomycetota bacterium]